MAKHALPSPVWDRFWVIVLPAALVLLGSGLRVQQWLYNRALWLDEALVEGDITERGYLELLAPLENGQVAPIGWLWAARTSVELGGGTELALRLPALLAGIGALLAGWWVGRMLLGRTRAWVLVGALALAPALVRYSNEVKPYEGDAFWGLLVVGAALASARMRSRGRAWACFAGVSVLAALCSHGATFLVAGATLALVVLPGGEVRGAQGFVRRVGFGAGGLLAGGLWALVHASSLERNAQSTGLRQFWAAGFPPEEGGFRRWLGESSVRYLGEVGSVGIVEEPLGQAAGTGALHPGGELAGAHLPGVLEAHAGIVAAVVGICVAVALFAGVWALSARGREGGRIAIVLIAPVCVQLGAAVAGVYPLGGRISLGLLGLVLAALTLGVDATPHPWLRGRRPRWTVSSTQLRVGLSTLALGVVFLGWGAHASHSVSAPTEVEEVASVLRELSGRFEEGDVLVAESRTLPQLEYYEELLEAPPRYVLAAASNCESEGGRERALRLRKMHPRIWVVETYSTTSRREAVRGVTAGLGTAVEVIEAQGARAVLVGGGVPGEVACLVINERR